MRTKQELGEAIRRGRRAALVINARSRRGRRLYDRARSRLAAAGFDLVGAFPVDRPGQLEESLVAAIDLGVRRNGYGRQVDSFEADLDVKGIDGPFHAVFIRAPVVERVGASIDVLAEHDGNVVMARGGAVFVSSFHPELTADGRLHALFLQEV